MTYFVLFDIVLYLQCNGNITDSAAGSKLSFFEDGNSLHLVMTIADEARVRTGFKVRSINPKF